MPDAEFTIGHLSRERGCKVPTIRYYEKIGLLPEPARTAGRIADDVLAGMSDAFDAVVSPLVV